MLEKIKDKLHRIPTLERSISVPRVARRGGRAAGSSVGG